MADPIKKGTRPDGSTFYWFRVSAGRNASPGLRTWDFT